MKFIYIEKDMQKALNVIANKILQKKARLKFKVLQATI